MSTISKTNPNSNMSSKTNDGLDPQYLNPISIVAPLTLLGVAPQFYIGTNPSDKGRITYDTSVFDLITQDNANFKLTNTYGLINRNFKVNNGTSSNTIEIGASQLTYNTSVFDLITQDNANFKLTNTYCLINRNFRVHNGTNSNTIEIGASQSQKGTIKYNEYDTGLYQLQLSTQADSTYFSLKPTIVDLNQDLRIFKTLNNPETMSLTFRNAAADIDERSASIFYSEIVPSPSEEGAQLTLNVPANTRSAPPTPGSNIQLLQDKIITSSKLSVTGSGPTFYLGSNDTIRSTTTYADLGSSNYAMTLTTHQGSYVQIQSTRILTNKNVQIYTGTTSAKIEMGNTNSQKATMNYYEYSPGFYELLFSTQSGTIVGMNDEKIYTNKNVQIYTGTNLAKIEFGNTNSQKATMNYYEYSPGFYELQFTTQAGTIVGMNDEKIYTNQNLEIYKSITNPATIDILLSNTGTLNDEERYGKIFYSESGAQDFAQLTLTTPPNITYSKPGSTLLLAEDRVESTAPLKVFGTSRDIHVGLDTGECGVITYKDFGGGDNGFEFKTQDTTKLNLKNNTGLGSVSLSLVKASTLIDFTLQQDTLDSPEERNAFFKYSETGDPGEEDPTLEIGVPFNTRIVPPTPGSNLRFDSSSISLDAPAIRILTSGINAESYLYLGGDYTLTSTQPPPQSWTPYIIFTTPGTNSVTYTSQTGLAWEYGNVTYIQFSLSCTVNITGATNIRITSGTTPTLTYTAITKISPITFADQSAIVGTRFLLGSSSEVAQTSPSWIVSLNAPGAFNIWVYWQPGAGAGQTAVFHGTAYLIHA